MYKPQCLPGSTTKSDVEDGYQRFFSIRQPGDLLFLVNEINAHGTQISPRGLPTMEMRNIIVQFEPDCDFLPSACNGLDGINEECKRFYIKDKKFADKRVTHAIHKTEFEMNQTIEQLRDHPATRRARILECDYAPFNIPCIQSTQFFRRDGQLCCSMFLRSSDTIKVLPLDVYLAQRLQDRIINTKSSNLKPSLANTLSGKDVKVFNLPRGPVTCLISSSHYYISDLV